MQTIQTIFSTRELAAIIWICIFLCIILINKKIRNSFSLLLKAFFDRKIQTIVFLLLIYIFIVVFLFKELSFWDISFLKDTVFWFFTVALVLLFDYNKIKGLKSFKEIIKKTLKWTIIIQFMANYYTFSLKAELILVPVFIIINLLIAYSPTIDRGEKVVGFLSKTLGIIVLMVFLFAFYKIVVNFDTFFTLINLKIFVWIPILTILFLPFLYIQTLYMKYELLFCHINFMTKDLSLRRALKMQVIRRAKFNLDKLTAIRLDFSTDSLSLIN